VREKRIEFSVRERPEACYQIAKIELNIDKRPLLAVQKIFKKVKKKLVTPRNVDNA